MVGINGVGRVTVVLRIQCDEPVGGTLEVSLNFERNSALHFEIAINRGPP